MSGSEIVAMQAQLSDGSHVYVMPYARVDEAGSTYFLATLAEDPRQALVLALAGERLIQLVGPEADRIINLVGRS